MSAQSIAIARDLKSSKILIKKEAFFQLFGKSFEKDKFLTDSDRFWEVSFSKRGRFFRKTVRIQKVIKTQKKIKKNKKNL